MPRNQVARNQVEGLGGAQSDLDRSAASLKTMLSEAEHALAAGDMELAERQAKAVSALVKARRDVAELAAFARAQPPEEDEDALREELRRRLLRFADAGLAGAPAEVLERLAAETGSL